MLSLHRLLTLLVALLVAAVTAVVVPTTTGRPAAAAEDGQEPKTYTWNDDPAVDGYGDGIWSKETNWDPTGVPQDGDIVIIEGDPNDQWVIQGIPAIELSELIVSGTPRTRLLRGDRITVTDRMELSGNVGLEIDVVVAAGAQAAVLLAERVGCNSGKTRCAEIGQDSTLTVEGTLDLVAPADPGDQAELMLWGDSDVVVAPGGQLNSVGGTEIASGLCCSSGMSTLRNLGTISVGGAGLTTTSLEVDNRATVQVAEEATWVHDGGGFRSQGGSYGGGGLVDVLDSYPVRGNAPEPGVTDGTFEVAGGLELDDGTTVQLGDWVDVTGTGAVTGDGSVRLAGPDLRGQVEFGPGVDVATVAGTETRQRAHHQQLEGFHGDVTFAGGFRVVNGSSYVLDAGTTARVPAGQVLEVQRGGTMSASSCCGNPAVLEVDPNATVRIGSDGGAEQAVFRQIRMVNPGRLELHNQVRWQPESAAFTAGSQVLGWGRVEGDLDTGPASLQSMQHLEVTGDVTMGEAGRLRTVVLPVRDLPRVATTLEVGGTFRPAGELRTVGASRHEVDTAVDVVTASQIIGGFACISAPGWNPAVTGTTLTLTADGTDSEHCVHPAPAKLFRGKVSDLERFRVPGRAGARWVKLGVTVSRATRATTLRVGSPAGYATIEVPRRKRSTTYVVVPFRKAKPVFTVRIGRGKAKVAVDQVAVLEKRPAQ